MDAKEIAALNSMRTPVSVADENRYLRAMFYGDFGCLKTTVAAMMVENKGAIVTTDSCWTVLQGYPDLAKKIDRYPFEGFAQLRAMAVAHDEGIEPFASYDTIIWDTVSTSVQIALRVFVDAFKFEKEQLHPEVEGRPHYRLAERAMVNTIKVLNQSNLNIIYIAHVREPTDADMKKSKYAIRPNMPDASYKAVGQEVALIAWLHRDDQGNPVAQVRGTKLVTAKSQIPTVQDSMYSSLDLPELIRKWKETV